MWGVWEVKFLGKRAAVGQNWPNFGGVENWAPVKSDQISDLHKLTSLNTN